MCGQLSRAMRLDEIVQGEGEYIKKRIKDRQGTKVNNV